MIGYRPDIDGLRALAVASVVIYHLNESFLTGGFVGVDLFFVISGYLITRLIVNEVSTTGKFSYRTFYLRRFRRLFPALLATLLLSIGLGYVLLAPSDLVEMAQSLIAALFSVSNFFFWSEAGYFDTASSAKPLLHTWSLSVEEQFYLVWPAVLVWLCTLKRSAAVPVIIIFVGVASWLLNELFFSQQERIASLFPNEDNQALLEVRSTVFYLLPFRVFEFAIGAILVWAPPLLNRKWAEEVLFAFGLTMVAYALITFDSETEFPSSAALIPCVGAALMIYSGPSHKLSFILSNRVAVAIGLVSYSLYLFHWPLIVYFKYWTGLEIKGIEAIGIATLSLLMAYLSYRFVEQPFRRPKPKTEANTSPNRPFVVAGLAAVLVISLVSLDSIRSKGWVWRYPAELLEQLSYERDYYAKNFWDDARRHEKPFSNEEKPKVLVIGDSMAAGLMSVLVAAGVDKQVDLASILIGENCKSLFGLSDIQYEAAYAGAKKVCRAEHQRALSVNQLVDQADIIFLASYWWEEHILKYLPTTAKFLKQASGADIYVMGMNVQMNNGIWFLSKNAFTPQLEKLRTPLHPKTVILNSIIKRNAGDYVYFDLTDGFCNQDGCQRITKEGYPVIFDDSHFSAKGADLVANEIKNRSWFRSLNKR